MSGSEWELAGVSVKICSNLSKSPMINATQFPSELSQNTNFRSCHGIANRNLAKGLDRC